jgi:hypothetical protein
MIYLSGMKFSQAPSTILMVRPAAFGFNHQTADSNAFQQRLVSDQIEIHKRALDEFNRMVDTLEAHDIHVIVADDSSIPEKPDAIFPNNWISFHHDGSVVLYPMLAENRRLERNFTFVELIKKQFSVKELVDLSGYEAQAKYLEGTGSIVFDYANRIAYANSSPRTDENVFIELCDQLKFKPILFDAVDESGTPIYHTNVLMCVGEKFVTVCLDAIKSDEDQEVLLNSFSKTGHQVIAISYSQMQSFAGNMIEVTARSGEPIVLMSETAFNSLLPGQLHGINKHAEVLPLSIPTIETFGGGSVRCMVAGIFLREL